MHSVGTTGDIDNSGVLGFVKGGGQKSGEEIVAEVVDSELSLISLFCCFPNR